MKRHALLLGYSGWDIPGKAPLLGVSYDLENYKNFLMSINGGAWEDSEITILKDRDLINLEYKILRIKEQRNDIVFSVFTGHGDFDNVEEFCRELEISRYSTISEKKLWGLANKQILICDSCSVLKRDNFNESVFDRYDFCIKEASNKRILARKKYEEMLLCCPNQMLRFYSSKVGTAARDTSKGGVYSKILIDTLKNSMEEISIVTAHDIASNIVIKKMTYAGNENEQIPEKDVPRIHNYLPGNIII